MIYKNRVKKRKRDRFTNANKDGAAKVIKPYWKKPKLSHFSFVKTKVSGKCHHYTEIKRKNVLWVISFDLFDSLPMWIGWNRIRSTNNPAKQHICYIKPIQLSPTRIDVLKETMHWSQIVAEECRQDYALVTYNLPIANIAKKQQLMIFSFYFVHTILICHYFHHLEEW